MATEALKSTTLTNLDATTAPFIVLRPTTGEGGEGHLRRVEEYVTISANKDAGSTYRLVRLASNVKLKKLLFASEAQGAGKVNLSLYYSDSVYDGTQVALQGLIVTAAPGGDQFFAADIDISSAVTITDKINANSNYTLDKFNQPLWKTVGLATDPGGYFDVVAVSHTTAITTGTGKLGVAAEFVM